MLQLRGFDPADRAEIVRLLAGGRPAGYVELKTGIFDWQYRQSPHDDGGTPFVVGTFGGEIVGVNGFMPVRVRFRGEPARASWGADTYVAAAHRGKGFARALVEAAGARAPIMLAYGISDMLDPVSEHMNWLLHRDIHLLYFSASEPGLRGAAKNVWTRISRARHEAGHLRSGPVERDVDTDFGGEVDDLWRRCAAGYWSVVERDAAYLNWKYRRHPVHRYACYSARDGGRLRGLMLARHNAVESVIVDYCGPADDGDLMWRLAEEAVADLIRRGTVRVRCETTHRPMVEALKRLGMHEARRTSRFRVYAGGTRDVDILRDWFLMSGDGDNDLFPVA